MNIDADKIITGTIMTVIAGLGSWFFKINRRINTHEAQIKAVMDSQKEDAAIRSEMSLDIKEISATMNQIKGKLER